MPLLDLIPALRAKVKVWSNDHGNSGHRKGVSPNDNLLENPMLAINNRGTVQGSGPSTEFEGPVADARTLDPRNAAGSAGSKTSTRIIPGDLLAARLLPVLTRQGCLREDIHRAIEAVQPHELYSPKEAETIRSLKVQIRGAYETPEEVTDHESDGRVFHRSVSELGTTSRKAALPTGPIEGSSASPGGLSSPWRLGGTTRVEKSPKASTIPHLCSIPEVLALREQLMRLFHDCPTAGHWGVKKMLELISRHFI